MFFLGGRADAFSAAIVPPETQKATAKLLPLPLFWGFQRVFCGSSGV